MSTTLPPGPLLTPEFLQRLERLELVSRKIFRGQLKGERRSPRKGQSVEFADFRSYVAGDDLRFVDWNTYARLDRLFLKMFLEEEDLRFYLLVDNSRSMDFGTPTKLDYARRVAAALGFIALVHSDRVKLEVLGDGEPRQALRGRRHVWRWFEQVAAIEPAGGTDLAGAVRRFCLANAGRGVVVLLSDLLDKRGYAEALRYFVARQFDVYVIQILSAEEIEPRLQGDLRLVDSEDGDETEITAGGQLLKRYRQTLEALVGSIRAFCHRRGIVYLLANNQVPFEDLVTQYLRARGLVR